MKATGQDKSAPRGKGARAGGGAASGALLAAALRQLGDGVLILEPHPGGGPRIVFANASFCAMTGYTAAELAGRRLDLLHPAGRRWRGREFAPPGAGQSAEGDLRRKDGAVICAAWKISPLDAGRGRPARVAAVYRDLTERRRLQEALIHAQRLDATGRLASSLAHDFNNLLAVINGYCEILAGELTGSPHGRKGIAEIHKAGQKAVALTRQLLAFSRRQELNPRVVNLNQLLRDLADILRRLLGPANRLEFSLAADLDNICVDSAQLQQVILNLVINARDALPAGGRVTLRTANQPAPDGPGVALAVTDNGTGMDERTQSRLFEPFFTTKAAGKGTGLGLSTAYGVVRQSGGAITVRSAPGRGSTFEVWLPAVREPAEEGEGAAPPLTATRGHETVLLVEEDALVRKMVAGILAASGYGVLAAAEAREARRAVRRRARTVQLVIADFSAPDQAAGALAQALHRANPTLCLLDLAGAGEAAELAWLPPARRARIHKPFQLSALLREVRRLLDAREKPATRKGVALRRRRAH